MFTTPHTDVSHCEVQATRRAQAQSKHNANKKFMITSPGEIQYVVAKDNVCERDCYFFLPFTVEKKEKKTFM